MGGSTQAKEHRRDLIRHLIPYNPPASKLQSVLKERFGIDVTVRTCHNDKKALIQEGAQRSREKYDYIVDMLHNNLMMLQEHNIDMWTRAKPHHREKYQAPIIEVHDRFMKLHHIEQLPNHETNVNFNIPRPVQVTFIEADKGKLYRDEAPIDADIVKPDELTDGTSS